jgi:hypothetical protein
MLLVTSRSFDALLDTILEFKNWRFQIPKSLEVTGEYNFDLKPKSLELTRKWFIRCVTSSGF